MSGQLQTNNCAYYPGYNVGCSISDTRAPSYGASFNAQGGGVYAMQWTSDYIRIWYFARGTIPSDIANQTPNPSSWGLPAAEFQGSCMIDQKFQAHKIIMNNAFCGEYAGAASVWNSSTNSCAASTNYGTCNAYVAGQPAAFQNAYWSINSVRVYQLAGSSSNATSSPYIASLQPTSTISSTSSTPTPTPTTSLCPGYNFTVVQSGAFKYEIECGINPSGSDLGAPYSGYPVNSFEDCVGGCSYWNANVTANICGAVAYQISNKACYWKRSAGSTPLNPAFNGARLIYYAYPQVTDDPRSQTTTTSSSSYVQTVATPNTYVNPSVTSTTSFSLFLAFGYGNVFNIDFELYVEHAYYTVADYIEQFVYSYDIAQSDHVLRNNLFHDRDHDHDHNIVVSKQKRNQPISINEFEYQHDQQNLINAVVAHVRSIIDCGHVESRVANDYDDSSE
ncbi:hypothetical protein LTS15_011243 [Exophiala xenobiotica]|nr:hypothetical protein LTS15_011243 [Exophiala xenobiotica]